MGTHPLEAPGAGGAGGGQPLSSAAGGCWSPQHQLGAAGPGWSGRRQQRAGKGGCSPASHHGQQRRNPALARLERARGACPGLPARLAGLPATRPPPCGLLPANCLLVFLEARAACAGPPGDGKWLTGVKATAWASCLHLFLQAQLQTQPSWSARWLFASGAGAAPAGGPVRSFRRVLGKPPPPGRGHSAPAAMPPCRGADLPASWGPGQAGARG